MSKKIYRKEIAKEQLRTAIDIFLKDIDLSSVITLAGAASNILEQLVRNEKKEPFTDYTGRVINYYHGFTPKRQKLKHHTEKLLGIIEHKHMSNSCSDSVYMNLFNSAQFAVDRAIADYIILYGQNEFFVRNYLAWRYSTDKNHDDIINRYKQIPDKLKRSKDD